MAAVDPANRIAELSARLEHLSRRYYVDGVSEVSDAEYDVLFRELQELEQAHPELVGAPRLHGCDRV